MHLHRNHPMRTPFPAIIAASFMLVGCSPAGKGPLSFQSPAYWTVEHTAPGGLDFYTVTARAPGGGLLILSRWPPPSRHEDIPNLVRQLADGFLKEAKKSSEFRLGSEEYRFGQFVGQHSQGSYATFQVATSSGTNTLQVMFMMSAGGSIWNGQFRAYP